MSNFFKIAGLSKAHSQVVRDMEARTFATAKVQGVAHFSGAVSAGAAHRVAHNFAKRFIEPAMESTTEGFMAKQGTAAFEVLMLNSYVWLKPRKIPLLFHG